MASVKSIFFALLLCLHSACTETPSPPKKPAAKPTIDTAFPSDALTRHIESYGRYQGESAKFSGYVLVARNGVPVYGKGFCCSDRDERSIPNHHTRFLIGSITKNITAAAILRLQQQGRLSVTDKVSKYVPAFVHGDKVTIHHLLSHTAGIPNYTNMVDVWGKREKPITVPALIETFADKPLEFTPGESYSYSNSGYVLLGAIIEKVSGTTYREYVQKELFAKAGMRRALVGEYPDREVARGYTVNDDGKIVPAKQVALSVAYSAGNIVASAHELALWTEALWDGRIIKPSLLTKMLTPVKKNYGYGWIIGEFKGRKLIAHGGGIDGFATTVWLFPEHKELVIVFSNNDRATPATIARAAADGLLGNTIELAEESKPVAVPATQLEKYAGHFSITAASRKGLEGSGVNEMIIKSIETIDIKVSGGGLTAKPAGQPAFPLIAKTQQSFRFDTAKVAVSFSEDGKKMTLSQGGLTVSYEKNNAAAKKP